MDDLAQRQRTDGLRPAAIQGGGAASNASALEGASCSGAMGAPFTPLTSPEHTRVDIATLQRFLDSLDEQALLLELDKRRGGGATRRAEPELNKGESNYSAASGEVSGGGLGNERGGGSVEVAVARSLAKSQQQRRLRVWEAPLAGSWLLLKGGFFFDEIITPATVQAATRLVAVPNPDMLIQMATLTAIDAANFSPPLNIGLAPAPMSPEDHFETFVDVFVTMLKLGMSDAASVSVSSWHSSEAIYG